MEHLKNGALNSAGNLADIVTDDAQELYEALAKRGQRASKALGKQIEEQPIASLLVAFAAGFIMSKLTDRN